MSIQDFHYVSVILSCGGGGELPAEPVLDLRHTTSYLSIDVNFGWHSITIGRCVQQSLYLEHLLPSADGIYLSLAFRTQAGERLQVHSSFPVFIPFILPNPPCPDCAETMKKVQEFYSSLDFTDGSPVEGAQSGIRDLRAMGYRLCIVTARSGEGRMKSVTEAWVRAYFPGEF